MFFKYKTRKIVLLGINELSIHFAKKLNRENDIILLDKKYDPLYNDLDLFIEIIDEDLFTSFQKIGISTLDYMIGFTNNDEYNLFASNLAKGLGAKKIFSMVKSYNYINIKSELIFNPYQIIISRIENLIKETRFKYIKNFIPGRIDITELLIRDNDSLSKKKVKDINIKDGLIIAIKRKKKTIIPNGDFQISIGDILYIIYKKDNIGNIFKQLWKSVKVRKKLFIIGGNDLAYLTAKNLRNIFETVIIIEPELVNCNRLAEKAENILILQGEGTETKLLIDEGLDDNSIVLALDNNDFHNILSSYLCKEIGCKNVITLINHYKYKTIADSLDLISLILPELVSKYLLQQIDSENNYDKLFLRDDIIISKIRIEKKSSVINKSISNLNQKGIIIAVIIRDNEALLANYEQKLKENDLIVVLSYKSIEYKIYNLFK
ncbi:MAG: NAD-binding protein [bacterium]